MQTEIIQIKDREDIADKLMSAVSFLKAGELVVFPTETVYGLGACGLKGDAVEKIFQVKGRPADNPLILHIASFEMLHEIAHWQEDYQSLLDAFWPGPLTVVLKKKEQVPDAVSAGLDTVAVRWPSGKVAQELIKMAGFPLAAPSANRSGRPSPTTADMVKHELFGKVSCIIDGGDCELGLESTVVDLSGPLPLLLRPGSITLEDLLHYLPDLSLQGKKKQPIRSPGMKYRHYKPDTNIVIFIGEKNIPKIVEKYEARKPVILTRNKLLTDLKTIRFDSLEDFARQLYAVFFQLEKSGCDLILIEKPEDSGLGSTLLNRIVKAADEIIE